MRPVIQIRRVPPPLRTSRTPDTPTRGNSPGSDPLLYQSFPNLLRTFRFGIVQGFPRGPLTLDRVSLLSVPYRGTLKATRS